MELIFARFQSRTFYKRDHACFINDKLFWKEDRVQGLLPIIAGKVEGVVLFKVKYSSNFVKQKYKIRFCYLCDS